MHALIKRQLWAAIIIIVGAFVIAAASPAAPRRTRRRAPSSRFRCALVGSSRANMARCSLRSTKRLFRRGRPRCETQ